MSCDKKYLLKRAKKYERNGEFTMAASNYSEAGEFEKAGDLLISYPDDYLSYGGQRLKTAIGYYLQGGYNEKAIKTWEKLLQSKDNTWCSNYFDELCDIYGVQGLIERVKDLDPKCLVMILEEKGYIDEGFNLSLQKEECRAWIHPFAFKKAAIYERKGEFKKAARMFEDIGYRDQAIDFYRKCKDWNKIEEIIKREYDSREGNYSTIINERIIKIYLEEKEYDQAEDFVLKVEGEAKRGSACRVLADFYIKNDLFGKLKNWVDRVCENLDEQFDCIYPSKGLISGFNLINFELEEKGRIEDLVYFAKKMKKPLWAFGVGRYLDELEIKIDINMETADIITTFEKLKNELERKQGLKMIENEGRLDELIYYYKEKNRITEAAELCKFSGKSDASAAKVFEEAGMFEEASKIYEKKNQEKKVPLKQIEFDKIGKVKKSNKNAIYSKEEIEARMDRLDDLLIDGGISEQKHSELTNKWKEKLESLGRDI